MAISNTLKVVGGLALLSSLFAYKKKGDYTEVIKKMTFDIRKVRNIKWTGGKIQLTMDLGFINNTNLDLSVSTAGQIQLKQIALFHKGIVIGNAYSNATKFELFANSKYLIENIQVELLPLNIAKSFLANNGALDTNIDNYRVDVTMFALGRSWVIEQ